MWRIKHLADPDGVLGPDTVLSEDPGIHLRSFKSTPPIEDVATRRIECGFCEPVCPSRNVTLTPRQRIVVRREMARQPEGSAILASLHSDFEYDGIETCAVDGSCAVPCPVSIDTGALVRGFREAESTPAREKVALRLAKRWATAERLARLGLGAADVVTRTVGTRALTGLGWAGLGAAARIAISEELMPSVPGPMPRPAPRNLPATTRRDAVAVYFPACVNRIFGRAPGTERGPSLPEALVTVSARAGRPLWIPNDVRGLCCALPWSSKGYREGRDWMAAAMADALWRWTENGRLPVVVDAASCTHGLVSVVGEHLDNERKERFGQIRIFDAITWAHQELLPNLRVTGTLGSAALHPTCPGPGLWTGDPGTVRPRRHTVANRTLPTAQVRRQAVATRRRHGGGTTDDCTSGRGTR